MTASAPFSDTQLSRLQHGALAQSLWQIVNSFVPYVLISAILYAVPDLAWWAKPALWVLAAGFVVRIFIIQHDCGHGSFFKSRRANEIVGLITSLITLAPYAQWRRHHGQHHANWNNLDCRDSGLDIYSTCLTVEEYAGLSALEQRRYRMMRNPAVSLFLLPPIVFLVLYRIPFDSPDSWRKEKAGVHLTNLGILILLLVLGFSFGFGRVLSAQIPITIIAATVGVWLFSLQHRFENTLWARKDDWSAIDAALQGSSYLRLPRILQWFTGNIGFHHVHHLNPRVPNYRLERCHNASADLQRAPVLSLWSGLKSWRYALWDEARGTMVPFPKPARSVPA
ncbi:MAG: fatty acid desaturase [Rhodospirillales bacterium]|nr:fatty acid desaturase [Rhodospirillales bacterium]